VIVCVSPNVANLKREVCDMEILCCGKHISNLETRDNALFFKCPVCQKEYVIRELLGYKEKVWVSSGECDIIKEN